MRIISGTHKGRRLQAPKKLPVRPTTDRAKEALFNILMHQFQFSDLAVLDLFSGIGSIAFEFASRGTKDITCVDANQKCCRYLTETSELLEAECKVIKSDALQYLQQTPKQFDVIFADPPYEIETSKLTDLINTVIQQKLLINENSLLIVEHSKFIDLSDHNYITEYRNYGLSIFSFFRKVTKS